MSILIKVMVKRENVTKPNKTQINYRLEALGEFSKELRQVEQEIKDIKIRKESYIELHNRQLQQLYKAERRLNELIKKFR